MRKILLRTSFTAAMAGLAVAGGFAASNGGLQQAQRHVITPDVQTNQIAQRHVITPDSPANSGMVS